MEKTFDSTAGRIAEDFRLERLIELMESGVGPRDRQVGIEFASWHILIAAMPLASDAYNFLYNWLCDAESLYGRGEAKAACYELKSVLKKIKRLGVDFVASPRPTTASEEHGVREDSPEMLLPIMAHVPERHEERVLKI